MRTNDPKKSASRLSLKAALVAGAVLCVPGIAYAVVTTIKGGPIQSITIVRGTDATSTNTGAFVDVPGATSTIKVKDDRLVTVRFSAESVCQGTSPGSFCTARVVMIKNGVTTELDPVISTDFAFDSGDANDYWESHAMDRSIIVPSKGKYEFRIQYSSLASSTTFRLDDWSMTIETSVPK